MSFTPVAVYGLKVPTGGIMVPAALEFPATIRITMAAIDPTQTPEADSEGNVPSVPRATLKILKAPVDDEDEDDEDEEADEYLQQLLGEGSDDDDEDDEEEPNGGPSDPSKSKKAKAEAALKKLLAAAEEEESDEEMDDADAKPNGSKKGKGKASDEDDDESDDCDSEDLDALDLEEYVVCTLDTERTYQQPIDITINENEKIFFVASGTHTIHLSGNYVIPLDEEDDEDDDEDYDYPPDEDELDMMDEDDVSDDLDPIDHADRVQELGSDDEEAPKLVKVESKKGKKRSAEDAAEGLDELIAKDAKLSKKQQKKLKNNNGEAVAAEEKASKDSPASAKSDKKVQFAKNLEQGPTGPAKDKADKAKGDKNAAGSVKVVQGVKIDDRKVGGGRTAKNGDKVGMRYIGKLESGKVFDSNKKGAPFSFKLGKGEVIKGWDIGIAGMAVGGERRLTIPAHLAYGTKGVPGIPPNSTLIFDVKLLEIK